MNKIMTVNFRGAELYGFQLGGIVYVALRPIVEAMGLGWSSQLKRVRRDPVLSKGVVMMTIPFNRGGPQEYVCLRLDLVHGWLFRIDSLRVRTDLQETVQNYQRECYDVLAQHFSGEREKLEQQKHESESLRVRMVSEIRQTFGIVAAQQAWKELGLIVVPAMTRTLVQLDLFDRAA